MDAYKATNELVNDTNQGTQSDVIMGIDDSPATGEQKSSSDCGMNDSLSNCPEMGFEKDTNNRVEKSVIRNFKQFVNDGPSFVCSCCTQTCFRD